MMNDLVSREAAIEAMFGQTICGVIVEGKYHAIDVTEAEKALRALPAAPAAKVKALVWSNHCPPDGKVFFYDHLGANTPWGDYQIDWKSWKEFGDYSLMFAGEYITSEPTLEAAKAAAQSDYEARILAALE